MKALGICLLLGGFLWLVSDALSGFVAYQHQRWIWQSQQLPEGETIERRAAVNAMRSMGLDLKNRHRFSLLPGGLMLLGGFLTAFNCTSWRAAPRRKPNDHEEP